MNLEEFSDTHKIVGFSTKPKLQKTVNENKYFDIHIPKATAQSLNLQPGQLLEIKIRNQNGKTTYFKREATSKTKGVKFYLPRSTVEELSIDENSVLDIFLSKD